MLLVCRVVALSFAPFAALARTSTSPVLVSSKTNVSILRITASLRAYCRSAFSSSAWDSARLSLIKVVKLGTAMKATMARMASTTISSTKVNPLTRVIRHPPFSACTICWPSDKMEFIAMTGCLSGTNRHFRNFYCDFKGVSGGGMVRTRGGCSYGYGGELGFLVGALRGRGTARCEGVGIDSHPGRVLLRSGGDSVFW